MTPVANQPTTFPKPETLNGPMILTLAAIRMTSAITGTATIAFSTADHTRAVTGLMARALAAAPTKVAAPIVA